MAPPKKFPFNPTEAAKRLLDEGRGIYDRMRERELTGKGLTKPGGHTKLKESIGEFGARTYVNRSYGGGKRELVIPRRGQMGPPVLDLVYELSGKRILVLEVKEGASRLGKTQGIVIGADEAGSARILKVKGSVPQFSPEWFQTRIDEIRKTNPRLANKLERAWMSGKLEAKVIYVDENGVVRKTDDRTDEWNRFKQHGRDARPAKPKSPKGAKPPKAAKPTKGAKPPKAVKTTKPSTKPAAKVAAPPTKPIQPAAEPVKPTTPPAAKPLAAKPAATVNVKPRLVNQSRIGSRIKLKTMRVVRLGGNIVASIVIGMLINWLGRQIFGESKEEKELKRLQNQFARDLDARLKAELERESVQQMLEAAPLYQQFWAKITYEVERAKDDFADPPEKVTALRVTGVEVAPYLVADTRVEIARRYSLTTVHIKDEFTTYQAIYEELSPGEDWAAHERPLTDAAFTSSHGPMWRIFFIFDYLRFSKENDLTAQYDAAWLAYRWELCALGYTAFHSPEELEACKDMGWYKSKEDERLRNDRCNASHHRSVPLAPRLERPVRPESRNPGLDRVIQHLNK